MADEFTAGLISHAQHRSSGVFAASTNPLVMVPDLAVGPLAATTLAVERIDAAQPGAQNLLGMDVLRHYCFRFRFDRSTLAPEHSPAADADRVLQMDAAGHPYVDVGRAVGRHPVVGAGVGPAGPEQARRGPEQVRRGRSSPAVRE
jgi:hypothetical protein